jgi:hypothetical protein
VRVRGEKKIDVIPSFVATNFTTCKLFYFWNAEEKNLDQFLKNYWTQTIVTKLSKIWVWDPGSGIRKNLFRISDTGSRGQKGTWSRIPDPDPQHCTTALYVMLDTVKKGVWAHPQPSPGWANFSIMMDCTPGSGHCHSVCTLWSAKPFFSVSPFFCLVCSQKVEFEDKCLLLTLRKLDFEKLWILARRGGERYTVYKHPPLLLLNKTGFLSATTTAGI